MALPNGDTRDTTDPNQTPIESPQVETPIEKERARKREIASYLSAASVPRDIDGVLRATSSDANITALVQLGAFKLETDRAFLSLLDGRNQYIVTEATRNHSIRKADESVFLGLSKLNISYGVCPRTIDYFTDSSGEMVMETPNVIADKRRYIINDFRADPHYKTRPYVTGFPYMVSYAEVPLVSPLGYVLGSYCVVDDKLREFDTEECIGILDEVADAIMTHLDLIRLKQNRTRAETLIKGLSEFMAREAPVPIGRDLSIASTISEQRMTATRIDSSLEQIKEQESSETLELVEPVYRPQIASYPSTSGQSHGTVSGSDDHTMLSSNTDIIDTPPSTPPDRANPFESIGLSSTTSDGQYDENAPLAVEPDPAEASHESTISSDIRATFARAAKTIRDAMDMSGILFLDAAPTGFGLHLTQSSPEEQEDQWQSMPVDDISTPDMANNACDIIAGSYETPLMPEKHLPEVLLQRFLRRYPRGHVFSADEFGPIDCDYGPGAMPKTLKQHRRRSSRSQHDVEELFAFLPNARYIIFLPLWHFQRETWFGATLGWTTSELAPIDVDSLSLLMAFGNSIMAEVSRFEALAISRAKSDFISSISHELRSPLHGILASGELLREAVDDPALISNLDMIDSCGRTLLDTFNNLLDYAKINNVSQSEAKDQGVDSGSQSPSTSKSANKLHDLSYLVQEVVDGVHLGFIKTIFQNTSDNESMFSTSQPEYDERGEHTPDETVLVTVNIEDRPTWISRLDSGSWKRVVMNIFGNALKYTRSGHIEVGLKLVELPNMAGQLKHQIRFSVKDTGIGMGSEYMKYSLYQPFCQENPLSVGSGLGLSIVQQLVKKLGGTLQIKSQIGVGTAVQVTVPLDNDMVDSLITNPRAAPVGSLSDSKKFLSGKSICYISPEAYKDLINRDFVMTIDVKDRAKAVYKALAKLASTGNEMNILLVNDHIIPDADLYFIDGHILGKSTKGKRYVSIHEHLPRPTAPLLVLCGARAGSPRLQKSELLHGTTYFIHHPLLPKRFTSVLLEATSSGKSKVFSHSQTSSPSTQAPETPNSSPESETLPNIAKEPLPVSSIRPSISAIESISPTTRPIPDTLIPSPDCQPLSAPAPTPKHLLLVDDNAINLKILMTVSQKTGSTYSTAINGLEAVQVYKASSKRFDLIFMDISMPVMSGLEATREIRAFERDMKMQPSKIVALTGLGSASSKKEAFASGTNMFLTKPIRLQAVRDLLNEGSDIETAASQASGQSLTSTVEVRSKSYSG
ncbi:hypothetical protein BT63DRAFT_423704 [Microthyrium microscopicum]|uniref:histidine kinase n=1 Tax=Microthyrium microscopicum TaxID=703497 RepID=A0A6A6UIY0_9PEZI|nr:hypothetical protein BT63DRAFT_423704 [Microthyrium microscopicum]